MIEEASYYVNQHVRSVVPVGIVNSVQRRLAGLSPEAADVLTTAAVLGNEFDVSLLGHLAGVGEPAAVNALNLASGVQLVEPCSGSREEFRFRHSADQGRDRVRSALAGARCPFGARCRGDRAGAP